MDTKTSGASTPSTQFTDEGGITVKLVTVEEEGGEPSQDETNITVEDTTEIKKDDTQVAANQATTTVEGEDEAGGKVDTNASRVINSLGEDKKVFAEKLLELAKKDDSSKEVVASLIKSKPDVEKYFKVKFGEDYDKLFKPGADIDKLSGADSATPFDEEKIRQEERTKATAEILYAELTRKKEESMDNFAAQQGYTPEEADQFKRYAKLLESELEFGEELLVKAGLVVNASKTTGAKIPKPVTGGDGGSAAPRKQESVVKVDDPVFQQIAGRLGRTPEDLAKGLEEVISKRAADGTYTFKL